MVDAVQANGSGKPGILSQANGSGGAADPFAGLDTGTREWIGKAGIKDVSSLIEKARNAEGLIGRSVQLPGDDAKPEDVDTYVRKATEKFRPKDAAGYELKLPDDIPKEMPYDGEFAGAFKTWAFEQGLTGRQAQSLHDQFVRQQAGSFKAEAEKLVKTAGDATAALEKAWGKQSSDAFKQNVELALAGVKESGGDELMQALRDAHLVGPGDIILAPSIALAFAKVGKFYAEDGMVEGRGSNAANNPYAAGNENMTEQNRLAKADPEKARRLIRQAGREADFPSLMQARA